MKFEVEGMAGDFWKSSAKKLRKLREEKDGMKGVRIGRMKQKRGSVENNE